MVRLFLIACFCWGVLVAANTKLFLKDGGYQLVREYKVLEDRVRYYSLERSDWEEIPLEMVDLKKTEAETKSREELLREDAKILDEEDKAERDARREVNRVPQDTGVYFVVSDKELQTLKQAETKIVNNKRRSILKAVSPIPIISGKATVELDGEKSSAVVPMERPEFYIRLNSEERFGIIRLTPQKGTRLVEKWTIIPVTKEIAEEQQTIEVFRKQVGDGLYKIWPTQPLENGEYAVVEYTEGKGNIQVWDFRVEHDAPKP